MRMEHRWNGAHMFWKYERIKDQDESNVSTKENEDHWPILELKEEHGSVVGLQMVIMETTQ